MFLLPNKTTQELPHPQVAITGEHKIHQEKFSP